jgi:hypothetical protein
MTVSNETASEFVAKLPTLSPGADVRDTLAFVQANREALLPALGESPGYERVRAGMLRLLEAVEPEADARVPLLEGAAKALEDYVPDAAPEKALRRPPAWVGISTLELGRLQGRDGAEVVGEAVQRAQAGFAALDDLTPSGPGETLWAMAEAAGDVGWYDWSHPLLDAAAEATFADDENRGRVWLLRILSRLERGDEEVGDAIEALLALPELDPQTEVHALWIGALRDQASDAVPSAVARLERALGLVDVEEDPDVVKRLREALRALGVRPDGSAEA